MSTIDQFFSRVPPNVPDFISKGEDFIVRNLPNSYALIRGTLDSRAVLSTSISQLHGVKYQLQNKFNIVDAISTRLMYLESFVISTLEAIYSVFVAVIYTALALVTCLNPKITFMAKKHWVTTANACCMIGINLAGMAKAIWGIKASEKIVEFSTEYVIEPLIRKELKKLATKSDFKELVGALRNVDITDPETYMPVMEALARVTQVVNDSMPVQNAGQSSLLPSDESAESEGEG